MIMLRNLFINVVAILMVLASHAVFALPEGASISALVQEVEKENGLPKPVLIDLVEDGVDLEDATRIAVSSSTTDIYAQAFTYHAICMSISEQQAQRVHDIAINAAENKFKNSVLAEARYTLFQYNQNRCNGVEQATRRPPVEAETISGTIVGGASISI